MSFQLMCCALLLSCAEALAVVIALTLQLPQAILATLAIVLRILIIDMHC